MKVFLTYGDSDFFLSKKLIKKEANKLNFFGKIITISPDDIPELYLQSPLMNYKKGGGYWLWKPYIIYNTLLNLKQGDILVYTDAGCELSASPKWDYYYSYLKKFSILLFEYNDNINYGWDKNKKWKNSVKISDWTKKNTLDYFNKKEISLNHDMINKLIAGIIICRKDENSVLFFKKVFEIMKNNPELVMDPSPQELKDQYNNFIEHRHDQSIFTLAAHCHKKEFNIKILPEYFEINSRVLDKPAILAKRRKLGKYDFLKYFKILFKKFILKIKRC